MHSVLSPLAKPFEPVYEFAIFNDGIPSSVYYGSHPEHEVLLHIEDDAIDETFPPSASDVAEIEAAEAYVDLMAWLAFLDECEESARSTFAGYKKRWESRRAAGLVGKPHTARALRNDALATVIAKAAAAHAGSVNVKETALIVPKAYEVRPMTNYKQGKAEFQKVNPKSIKVVHGHGNPIQQPRKHN